MTHMRPIPDYQPFLTSTLANSFLLRFRGSDLLTKMLKVTGVLELVVYDRRFIRPFSYILCLFIVCITYFMWHTVCDIQNVAYSVYLVMIYT